MIETAFKGMPDTLANSVAVMTAAAAAAADQLPPGTLNIGGALALVISLFIALQRGWIVTRREHEDVKTQRDSERANAEHWQGIALKALGVAEKVTDAAEVLTTPDPTKETTS